MLQSCSHHIVAESPLMLAVMLRVAALQPYPALSRGIMTLAYALQFIV